MGMTPHHLGVPVLTFPMERGCRVPRSSKTLWPTSQACAILNIADRRRAHHVLPASRGLIQFAVHPLHDHPLEGKSGQEERKRYKERVWAALGLAYQDSAHIRAWYSTQDGKVRQTADSRIFQGQGMGMDPGTSTFGYVILV